MKPYDSERFLIKSHLTDIYYEVDYLKRKEFVIPDIVYLEEAEKIVSPEIEHLRTRGRDTKHFQHLLLSLIKIKIIHDQYNIAEYLIQELLTIYNKFTKYDIND